MPEQESPGSGEQEFHPAVEEVMETSGPDIGRIKDVESAKRVANEEHFARERGYDDELKTMVIENSNKDQVGRVAAEHALDKENVASHISRNAREGTSPFEDPMVMGWGIGEAHNEATKAQASYDQLQKDKPVIQAKENAQLRAELDAERAKNSETDQT